VKDVLASIGVGGAKRVIWTLEYHSPSTT